jgi:hypothetical protein
MALVCGTHEVGTPCCPKHGLRGTFVYDKDKNPHCPVCDRERLLAPEEVANIITKLKTQETMAPYEKRLLNACDNWLLNYNRRRYG